VLKDIGADQVPQILVFNKLDAMEEVQLPRVLSDQMELDGHSVARIYVSAKTGEGLPELRAVLAEQVMAATRGQGPLGSGALPEIESPLS